MNYNEKLLVNERSFKNSKKSELCKGIFKTLKHLGWKFFAKTNDHF